MHDPVGGVREMCRAARSGGDDAVAIAGLAEVSTNELSASAEYADAADPREPMLVRWFAAGSSPRMT